MCCTALSRLVTLWNSLTITDRYMINGHRLSEHSFVSGFQSNTARANHLFSEYNKMLLHCLSRRPHRLEKHCFHSIPWQVFITCWECHLQSITQRSKVTVNLFKHHMLTQYQDQNKACIVLVIINTDHVSLLLRVPTICNCSRSKSVQPFLVDLHFKAKNPAIFLECERWSPSFFKKLWVLSILHVQAFRQLRQCSN
jgi:hypothetical protein